MKFYFGNIQIDSDKFNSGNEGLEFTQFKPIKNTFILDINKNLLVNENICKFLKEIITNISFKNSSITLFHRSKMYQVYSYSFLFNKKDQLFRIEAFFEEIEGTIPSGKFDYNKIVFSTVDHSKNFPEWYKCSGFCYRKNIEEIDTATNTDIKYIYTSSEFFFNLVDISDDMLSKAGLIPMDIEWGLDNSMVFKRKGDFYLENSKLISAGADISLLEEDHEIEML